MELAGFLVVQGHFLFLVGWMTNGGGLVAMPVGPLISKNVLVLCDLP